MGTSWLQCRSAGKKVRRIPGTYFTTTGGGAVFSTGSIAWCGSLAHNRYDNDVARITANVLDRFASEAPPAADSRIIAYAMAAGTVCLTFDFDAMSLWIVRGQTSPGPISRGEFGVLAIPRLLHLLERRGLPATFFVPGHTAETYPDACRQIVEAGHEIGMHGYAHEVVSTLAPAEERAVFRRAHDVLTRLVGTPPVGNRTPSWDLTAHTVEILLELGLRYDSSLMSTDYTPFYSRTGDEIGHGGPARFGPSTELIQLPPSWSLDDYPAFEYYRSDSFVMPGLRPADDVYGNWLEDVRYMVRDYDDGVCVLTFHPQVIGRGHRLLGLERFLDAAGELGIGFDRLDRVAEQFRAGRAYGVYRPGAA